MTAVCLRASGQSASGVSGRHSEGPRDPQRIPGRKKNSAVPRGAGGQFYYLAESEECVSDSSIDRLLPFIRRLSLVSQCVSDLSRVFFPFHFALIPLQEWRWKQRSS